jgi:hypothetical protein
MIRMPLRSGARAAVSIVRLTSALRLRLKSAVGALEDYNFITDATNGPSVHLDAIKAAAVVTSRREGRV